MAWIRIIVTKDVACCGMIALPVLGCFMPGSTFANATTQSSRIELSVVAF